MRRMHQPPYRKFSRWRLGAVWGPVKLIVISLFLSGAAAAADDEEQFLEGLRSRRLFRLAERVCLDRLSHTDLAPQEQAQFTIELIRCRTEHALHSMPQDRQARWSRALSTAEEFHTRFPRHVRALSVRFQHTLSLLARGELNRQELEVNSVDRSPQNASQWESARRNVRDAIRDLESLQDEAARTVSPRNSRTRNGRVEGGAFSEDDLLNLRHNILFQLARGYRNRALCYGPKTVDRIAALTQAKDQLDALLRRLSQGDSLRWPARLEKISCLRSLGDLNEAARELRDLVGKQPPPEVRLRAQAEAIHLELAAQRIEQARKIADQGGVLGGKSSAELDFARLEAYLALWRTAEQQPSRPAAERWQEKSLETVKEIEQRHGPYWIRRSELLLARRASSGSGTRNWEILARTADNLYRQGEHDQAIAAYQQAAEKSHTAGDARSAFKLWYKAALVDQKRGDHQQAAAGLQDLAGRFPENERASAAHLLAAWNVSRIAAESTVQTAAYEKLLVEHLEKWPNQPSAITARLWLARLRQTHRKWDQAARLLLDTPAAAKEYSVAVASAADCVFRHLRKRSDETTQDAASDSENDAIRWAEKFDHIARGGHSNESVSWTAWRRLAAMTAAKILLQYATAGQTKAAAILEQALTGQPPPPENWKASAQALLVVALARTPDRQSEAQTTLEQMAGGSPEELLEMVAGLSQVVQQSPAPQKTPIAELQLEAIKLLAPRRDQLSRASQKQLDLLLASTLAAAGDVSQANHAFLQLAKRHPRDGAIQVAYGEFLLSAKEPDQRRRAVDQWRSIARNSRPQTNRWYRAKYSTAVALFHLGEKQQASRLIRYLQATPPGLEKTSLRQEFLDLLARCSD